MKLYSKVKLVRKSSDVVYATPGSLAYHIGYVMLVGGSKDYRYADVYFKNHSFTRCIRMFYNKDEDRYMYYDNDNNTKIYFHKELSENISEKSWVYSSAASAIQYEIEKYSKLEDFHNYQFVANGPKASFCLVDDRHVSEHGKDSKEYKRMLENAQMMMRAHYSLNGFVSDHASDYFLYLIKGFDATLLKDFLPNVNQDIMYALYAIKSIKSDLIKNRLYEHASELRDYERCIIDILKVKSLFDHGTIKNSLKEIHITNDTLDQMFNKTIDDLVVFTDKVNPEIQEK